MKSQYNQICLLILLFSLTNSALAQAKSRFSDQQIEAMTGSYLKKLPGAPKFAGAKVYRHPERGKIYQVHLMVDRNRETEGLGYAFDVMLSLSQYFKKPPKVFMAVLHSDSRSAPPLICSGSAKCTEDHYIRKTITYKEWYTKCIQFEEPKTAAGP
ncbi:MAG: hypothetical protein VX822_00410 [Candidatus Neomarinimicrobiota bacterium]|nr:hypothetical protein [Candidatus Neomarinimicrobiota bacterium]